jgi:hypothetical protein
VALGYIYLIPTWNKRHTKEGVSETIESEIVFYSPKAGKAPGEGVCKLVCRLPVYRYVRVSEKFVLGL